MPLPGGCLRPSASGTTSGVMVPTHPPPSPGPGPKPPGPTHPTPTGPPRAHACEVADRCEFDPRCEVYAGTCVFLDPGEVDLCLR